MLNHFELDNTFEDQSLILDIYRCGMKNELADNVSRHFSIVQYFIFVHPHSFSFSSILDFLINNFKAKLYLRDFVFREFPFRRCPNIRRSTEEEVQSLSKMEVTTNSRFLCGDTNHQQGKCLLIEGSTKHLAIGAKMGKS